MTDYVLFMHDDVGAPPSAELWRTYFASLRERGVFEGGSSIGPGEVLRKEGPAAPVSGHLTGYIRLRAESLAAARDCIADNPVFTCGGSVELRELSAD